MSVNEALRIARIMLDESPERARNVYQVTEGQKAEAYDRIASLQANLEGFRNSLA